MKCNSLAFFYQFWRSERHGKIGGGGDQGGSAVSDLGLHHDRQFKGKVWKPIRKLNILIKPELKYLSNWKGNFFKNV